MFTADETERIAARYLVGETTPRIARSFGTYTNAIIRTLRHRGIRCRPPRLAHHWYKCDRRFFQVLDNEPKAYWLGFLAADGYVGRGYAIELALAEKDAEHVRRFRDALQSGHPIVTRVSNQKDARKRQRSTRITICSHDMAEDLAQYGVVQRKSLTLKFPDNIPAALLHHFIRGYFDGDGCVGSYLFARYKNPTLHFNFTGNRAFMQGLQMRLIRHARLSKTKIVQRERRATLQWGGNVLARRFYDYLYRDATVFLPRKKQVFDSVLLA